MTKALFPEWTKDVKSISLERISGALTNAVFFVNTDNKKRMMMRVYGNGVDQFIDRENELTWLSRLSKFDLCPRLLGTFGNGRFEQYLNSTTLTSETMRAPDTSKAIAGALRQIHDIVAVYPPSEDTQMGVWLNINCWYKMVEEMIPRLMARNENWAKVLKAKNLDNFADEIAECKRIAADTHSPTVFAHNDTQYGNLLRLEGSNELVTVDFEYASYNPRGFDICNHFCEWMYDYHAEDSAVLKRERYPTYEEQIRFLRAYIDSSSKFENPDMNDVDVTPESLHKETLVYVMVDCLQWYLWGIIQTDKSEIDFDYFLFSIQRLDAFREELAKWKA
ncbi:kinase-like protein [Backusella circina FSU 941]|nr:kinase-like protein [Backusella circina FSU 941]